VSINRLLSSSAESASGCFANFLLSAGQINTINHMTFFQASLELNYYSFMESIFKRKMSEFLQPINICM
jgi:hypothetical protein